MAGEATISATASVTADLTVKANHSARVTQLIVEGLSLPGQDVRATQLIVDGLALPGQDIRATQLIVDALAFPEADLRATQLIVEVLSIEGEAALDGEPVGSALVEGDLQALEPGLLEARIFGDSTVEGDPTVIVRVASVGRGTVLTGGTLDVGVSELDAEVFGSSTVTGDLFRSYDHPYQPVNYPLGHGFANIHEMYALALGRAEVFGFLDVDEEALSLGEGTVTGTLELDGPPAMDGESIGEGQVFGELYSPGTIYELDGESFGDATAFVVGGVTGGFTEFSNDSSIYYIYGNATAGFDPTDVVNGTDGHIRDFNRYLGLYKNINVGFDYTDDVSHYSTFVSQSYPDGDIIRDFARHKYQYLLVIPEVTPPFKRLTIGPAPRKPHDLTPTPRPPRKK